jgi:hypothetical protein
LIRTVLFLTTTGKTAPLTNQDEYENAAPGEIVALQWMISGQKVSTADEIWLSNRDKVGRYFSWADVLLVKDKKDRTERIAIVQRLTEDNDLMENQAWKIIWVELNGSVSEQNLTYLNRSENLLGVHLVMASNTALMSMGYYSDLLNVYPSLLYPIVYPAGTVLIGFVLILLSVFIYFVKRSQ